MRNVSVAIRPARIEIDRSVAGIRLAALDRGGARGSALAASAAHAVTGVGLGAFDGGGPVRPVLLRAGDVFIASDVRA